ncbi:MAG: 2-dehydropantoate 2-reductase, partial [Spirochaetaceae bacterium]|nr:2-dehydropantoate 2-reductase [Spirochaetaceae bacterium]
MEKRILVFGTGVIGSVYALRFAKAGCAVTAVARGDRLEALRKGGLRIRNAFLGDEEHADVQILDSVPHGTDFDIAIVAVRGDQILDALRKASDTAAGAIVVVGNNVGDYEAEAALAGNERLVLGFGAFGGYRDGGEIVYVDGRTREKPGDDRRARTTLGILAQVARPALDAALAAFAQAGLPTSECRDMRSYLACHAALVFPLAGAMYAAGGDQARFCGTRDAVLLGVRACKELFRSLLLAGYGMEPESLRRILV